MSEKQMPVQLTMLNGMAGADFEQALDRHVALGLRWLDLKDGIYGQSVNDLGVEDARRVANAIRDRNLGVYCLSTGLCYSDLAEGEEAFRTRHFATLERVLSIAPMLQPRVIRLLAARRSPLPQDEPPMARVRRDYAWAFEVYREMIDRIAAAGFQPTIENEVHDCIFASPAEILAFFETLDCPGKVHLTWDVQNLWQMGSAPPSLDVYQSLRPLIGGCHLKGGRSEGGGGQALVWASALEDASWPVTEVVRAVVTDGNVPVICLNPSHGKQPPGYDGWEVTQRNIAFLRREIEGIE
jgi:sugar phosphate isomerase/epimerase